MSIVAIAADERRVCKYAAFSVSEWLVRVVVWVAGYLRRGFCGEKRLLFGLFLE